MIHKVFFKRKKGLTDSNIVAYAKRQNNDTNTTYCYTIGDIFLNGWWSYFVVKGKRKNKVVNPKKRKT